MMTTHAINIAQTADFGDERLNKRLSTLSAALNKDLTAPITTACETSAAIKGAYRFFKNEKVTADAIITAHRKTLSSIQTNSEHTGRILQLDDTTEFDYTTKKGAEYLGVLNYKNRHGLYSHNSLIISELGVVDGVLKQTNWSREAEYLGQSEQRRCLPLEEKESFRWYDHFCYGQQCCEAIGNREWVYIADREADFMELLAAKTHDNMHFVIRSQYNRNLADQSVKLREKLALQPCQHVYEIDITHPETKKKRKAKVAVRFCPVQLKLCKPRPDGTIVPTVAVNAIEVREFHPPKDIEEPIYWVLLTTLKVKTVAQAMLVIHYYTLRWLIERFFYLMKSGGAKVEELQLKTQRRLENAIATYTIAVMNAMKIRYWAENQPNTPINQLGIDEKQHQALFTVMEQRYPNKIQYDPEDVPTIEEFCVVLGMLGGFIPSKRQPLPGLKILTRALAKYHLIVDVFLISQMSKN